MRFILFKNNQPLTRFKHGFRTLRHVKTRLMYDTISFIRQAITKLLHDFKAMFSHCIEADVKVAA